MAEKLLLEMSVLLTISGRPRQLPSREIQQNSRGHSGLLLKFSNSHMHMFSQKKEHETESVY